MRQRFLLAGAVFVSAVLVGCNREATTLAVRFTTPSVSHHGFAFDPAQDNVRMAAHPASATSDDPVVHDPVMRTFVRNASLWGGPYQGQDVTYELAQLASGNYKFDYWDVERRTDLRGTIAVSPFDESLADTFRRWKSDLPQRKKQLAFDFEIEGKAASTDHRALASLTRQLRAVEAFDRALDKAIAHEERNQKETCARNAKVLDQSMVLLFPGGEETDPPVQPAFSQSDLDRVRSGEVLTKVLVVANHQDLKWKLDHVNRLGRELQRLHDSTRDEARRLEGRKRFRSFDFANHDAFLHNEKRLQQVLAQADCYNEQLRLLRERRLQTAIAAEWATPDESFHPLDRELRDLEQERAVLAAEKQRVDLLFSRKDAASRERVEFEQRRQNVNGALAQLDDQLEFLGDARYAVAQLRERRSILHREGETLFVAAGVSDDEVPFRVREALQQASLMAVRVETRPAGVDGSFAGFAPPQTKNRGARTASSPEWSRPMNPTQD